MEARGGRPSPFDRKHNHKGRSSATPKERSMQPTLDLGSTTDHRVTSKSGPYGRGGGVGRGRGVGANLGVGVGLGVEVAVALLLPLLSE